MDLQNHFEQLEQTLGQQVAGLTALKNYLPRKRELVRKNDTAGLDELGLREEAQLRRLAQVEAQRGVLQQLLTRELGLPGGTPLSVLIPHAPAVLGPPLTERGRQLSTLVAQLREGQAEINEMLRISLDFVHHSMEIFAELATAASTQQYGADGDAEARPTGGWLVNQQA